MSDNAFEISLLSQGVGYGVVIGLGILFAVVILLAVRFQKDYLGEDSEKSEMFMVANRTVGTGLTCSAVFSSWMWINETVFSSVQGYKFGIAAPLWFASGVSFQISLMAVLGVLVKIRVPNAHTSLEIIRLRYGKLGHLTFIVLNLINNIVGCASMIVTGSQLLVGLTGINIAAATILIPVGVVLYTAVGGLKATFLTDFLHTTIALILIVYFTLSVITHDKVGGFQGLYDQLLATAEDNYVDGNYQGSLLSFKSKGAIIFGIILKFGNLALVIMDTAFWQKSFASEVNATVPGYNLAALAIFAVPWAMGTVMGLTARAFQNTSAYPFLPNGFSTAQVNAGYVMPYTIHAFLGAGGSVGMLLLLFMAVTSTVSSSMIAVSSILAYDVYRTYMNPQATDRQTVKASHLGVLVHGVVITGITLGLNYAGANINWLSYTTNMIKCPGIFPLIFTILWSRQSKAAAVAAPIGGMVCGLAVWLSTTYKIYGVINMTTTSQAEPCLYGALTATFAPVLFSVLISYLGPKEVFDWNEFLRIGKLLGPFISFLNLSRELFVSGDTISLDPGFLDSASSPRNVLRVVFANPERQIELVKDNDKESEKEVTASSGSGTSTPGPATKNISKIGDIRPAASDSKQASETIFSGTAENTDTEKVKSPQAASSSNSSIAEPVHPFDAETLAVLYRWYKIAWIFLAFIVSITFVAWPLPLYRDYIFPPKFFGGWITMSIVWQFFALGAVVIYPVYDGWGEISKVVRGLWRRHVRKSGSPPTVE